VNIVIPSYDDDIIQKIPTVLWPEKTDFFYNIRL